MTTRMIRRKIGLCLMVWTMGGAVGTAWAADFHVTTAQELQNALTLAAANGANDTIYLAAGYYIGNFNFNSDEAFELTIQGEPGADRAQITIDGDGVGRALNLTCSAAADITVTGITVLRNNNPGLLVSTASGEIVLNSCRFLSPTNKSGAAVEITSGYNAAIRNCIVSGGGAGVSIAGVSSAVSIQRCSIANNSPGVSINSGTTVSLSDNTFSSNSLGATIYGTTVTVNNNTFNNNSGPMNHCGGAKINGATVTVSNNTFSGNTAGYQSSEGGASISGSATVMVNNNTFSGNSGSGASISGSGTLTTVSNNTFSGNSGSGASISGSGTLTVNNNTFSGNSGSGAYIQQGTVTLNNNTFSGNSGGGAYIQQGTVTLNNNSFNGNSVSGSGGGAYIYGSAATLNGNRFRQNQANSGDGGGLCFYSGGMLKLFNNVFSGNDATTGGGMWIRAASSNILVNNTITENSAANGGGVVFQVDGVVEKLYVYNNIIWGNVASGNGGDVYLAGTGLRKEFMHNDAHSLYGVWDLAQDNLDVAPIFFDPVNANYHLRNTSLCINAGDNAAPELPSTDMDGEARIQNVTVDMGAYEFSNTDKHPADSDNNWVISDSEYTAYAAAWKNDQTWPRQPVPIPADYVTRAGYLKANGGAYHNDGGGGKPLCWKPGL